MLYLARRAGVGEAAHQWFSPATWLADDLRAAIEFGRTWRANSGVTASIDGNDGSS